MISAQGISLQFGGRPLFQHVDVQFTPGNCYGLIGANGTGKSTFLRILSGELEPSQGEVVVTPGERIAVLRQDHYQFDEYTALQTVIIGYARLHEVMQQKETLYAKPDFDDADGLPPCAAQVGELRRGLGMRPEPAGRAAAQRPACGEDVEHLGGVRTGCTGERSCLRKKAGQ